MVDAMRVSFSAFCLIAAMAIYAAFGSPTPDAPGLVEGAIGLLLICAIGLGRFRASIVAWEGTSFFRRALQVFFVCGLVLPTAAGLFYGQTSALIIRDLLAFSFLGLPLFLGERLKENPVAAKIFISLMIFIGLAFCARTLLPIFNVWIPQGELLYLSNSPIVLFAGLFLTGIAWNNLCAFNAAAALRAMAAIAGVAMIFAAMLLDTQRATIGAMAITLFLLMGFDLIQRPRRAVLPIAILVALAILAYPVLLQAVQAIFQKTASVGWNMRSAESMAVYEALSANPVTFLTGLGWGATFASPAVGLVDVNFTHSFFTTMLLKGGLPLFLLAVLVVLGALYEIFLIFQRDRLQGFSLFWPLMIPALFYASHKSLDFGLVLLAIAVWGTAPPALQGRFPSDRKT
jgi:hypothetical protein